MIKACAPEELPYAPEEVFRAGIQAETWPVVNGLHIEPDADEIVLGGLIRAKLQLPLISIGIDCTVTEFEHAERVRIEGRSRVARALLLFELQELEPGVTRVDYTFELEPKNFVGRRASPAVRLFAEKAVPEFARGFKQNVVQYLSR